MWFYDKIIWCIKWIMYVVEKFRYWRYLFGIYESKYMNESYSIKFWIREWNK